FYGGDDPWGYANADDDEALKAVQAAYGHGIRFFDTADVYGAGHSETLLGQALAGREDVVIATKFGVQFEPSTKQVRGANASPAYVDEAIEASRRRLRRDRLDLVFLHLNSLPPDDALPLFDRLDTLKNAGKIGAYGWSTDYPANAAALGDRPNFVAVQHAMNLFFDAPSMMRMLDEKDLISVNRSPLAMGVLTGKFQADGKVPTGDIRQNSYDWMDYFKDGAIVPAYAERLNAVRDLLTVGGRTLAQGSLAWLWAKSPRTLPIPGARTAAQAEENAGALAKGPLPPEIMAEIETFIHREPEGEARDR
ncbi:MAG: aldo/keto reductase, partial [Pseudomonadota bacterium]